VEDALVIEAADSPYVNILVVKEGNENSEAVQALIKALHSDAVKDYINSTFDGAVVPAF
jgi:D-methionine transport system substrate-binding protein